MGVQINLPEGLNISDFEVNMLLAAKLFEEGLITSGQGGEMVGLSKQAFVELLGKYKVSIFQYSIDEIEDVVRQEIHADLPNWIEVSSNYDLTQFQILQLELHLGEASAIALALENPGSKLIIDEFKGRSVAKRLGLSVTGTTGITIKAKEQGLIISGREMLVKLEIHGFWLSDKLKKQIIAMLNE